MQKNFGGDYGVLYVKLLLNEFLVPNVRFYLCMYFSMPCTATMREPTSTKQLEEQVGSKNAFDFLENKCFDLKYKPCSNIFRFQNLNGRYI